MSLFDDAPEEQSLFHLGMDEPMRADMMDAARWARFLAIMSLIFIGLLFALGIYLTVTLMNLYQAAPSSDGLAGFIGFVGFYFLLSVIYFYPSIALFRFGNQMKPALQTADQSRFNLALRQLRNMFKYIGILAIILLSLFGFSLLLTLLAD